MTIDMERKTKKYQGVVVPMVSPLTGNKEIDKVAVEKILHSFSKNDISPLVLGTTGESASFDKRERIELVEATVRAKGANQTIYVGLVGNNVRSNVNCANLYFDLGAEVAVATLPSYYVLTPDQMVNYYSTLADKLTGPLMMYNIKSTTQMSIPLEVVEKLSKHENIWGLKDSERDMERLNKCIRAYESREDFSFFCGWGGQSANSLKWGADGIVPSTGNVVPELYRDLYAAALNAEMDKADQLQLQTDKVARIYQENRTLGQSLAALKEMMGVLDLCSPYMMPPLTELNKAEKEQVQKVTKEYFGLIPST
jgi:dihydrodipicolinate synthase/N-acetylneuraminate lyase